MLQSTFVDEKTKYYIECCHT